MEDSVSRVLRLEMRKGKAVYLKLNWAAKKKYVFALKPMYQSIFIGVICDVNKKDNFLTPLLSPSSKINNRSII